jgi:short subunit dehydrogenase-like uncharacterized protein
VLYGATSFVGQILCRYLLAEFGTTKKPGARKLRWAVAGRSASKLAGLIRDLGVAAGDIEMLIAEASDEDGLLVIAKQTRVVISTVGPYALYGDALVKVCAESGTDYCDLTGEAHWVSRMITRYEAAAQNSGARIVHCCGFDSIPSDLGVWFLQTEATKQFGAPCVEVKMRVKAMRGAASGGTVASMLNVVREATRDKSIRREYANPYSLSIGAALPSPPPTTRQKSVRGPLFDPDFNVWMAPFVMAAINERIVLRSHALAGYPASKAFLYGEGMMMGKGLAGRARATSFSAGLGAFVAGAALAPTRWLMEKTILPVPGEGPSPAAQERGFWDYRFVGKTANGKLIRTRVTGDRDPGYGSTAKMLGEAAACLALDVPKNQLAGGFWTPATAMAAPLMQRLTAHAGLGFEVID